MICLLKCVDLQSSIFGSGAKTQNTWGAPKTVVPEVKQVKGAEWKGEWTVRKHSWCFFILTGRAS